MECWRDNVCSSVTTLITNWFYHFLTAFPKNPYHHLLKDYKIQSEQLNDSANDAAFVHGMFFDEVEAFNALDERLKAIIYALLKQASAQTAGHSRNRISSESCRRCSFSAC